MMSFYPSKTPTKCVYLVRLSVFHRSLRLCLHFFTLFSFYSWSSKISIVPSSISQIFLFPACSYLCLNFTSWAPHFVYESFQLLLEFLFSFSFRFSITGWMFHASFLFFIFFMSFFSSLMIFKTIVLNFVSSKFSIRSFLGADSVRNFLLQCRPHIPDVCLPCHFCGKLNS